MVGIGGVWERERDAPIADAEAPFPISAREAFDVAVAIDGEAIDRATDAFARPVIDLAHVASGRGRPINRQGHGQAAAKTCRWG